MTEEELKALQEQLEKQKQENEAKAKENEAKAEENARKEEELKAEKEKLENERKSIDASKTNAGEITATIKEGYEKKLAEQKAEYEGKISDYKDTISQLVGGKEQEPPLPSPLKELNETRAKDKLVW